MESHYQGCSGQTCRSMTPHQYPHWGCMACHCLETEMSVLTCALHWLMDRQEEWVELVDKVMQGGGGDGRDRPGDGGSGSGSIIKS